MRTPATEPQFDFGQNWIEYSRAALTAERMESAEADFSKLYRGIALEGRSFLEIGFGQGMSVVFAARAGARVVACDINPKCATALAETAKKFPGVDVSGIPLIFGSILDDKTTEALRAAAPQGRAAYDVVHSWGVLHHTGDMGRALRTAASLVADGGHLMAAIYNRHWSSRPWRWIKRLYVGSPGWARRLLVALCTVVIYIAKWAVTKRNPLLKERGMDFHYDVVDWVGGFPYEYASVAEFTRAARPLGLELVRAVPAQVPTGCNEYVFRKNLARREAF